MVKERRVMVRMGEDLYGRVAEYAEVHGEDMSAAMRVLLARGLDRQGIRRDIQQAVELTAPPAIRESIETATATQTDAIRRATVAAVVAVVATTQGLSQAEQQALVGRLLSAVSG